MKKITLTAEGETDEEVKATLLFMLGVGANGAEPKAEAESRPTKLKSEWTNDEMRRFWNALRSGAKQVLTEMAKRPDGYKFDDIRDALNMNALQIAGRLSSMGHQMRAFPGKPDLISRDWDGQAYKMRREFAELITKSR